MKIVTSLKKKRCSRREKKSSKDAIRSNFKYNSIIVKKKGEPKQSEDGQDNRFENQHWVSPTTQRDVHMVTGIWNLHLKFERISNLVFKCPYSRRYW